LLAAILVDAFVSLIDSNSNGFDSPLLFVLKMKNDLC
jgi:hypothetical protein